MDREEELRRRLVLYREYLRDGVTPTEAMMYLAQIKKDEAELAAFLDKRAIANLQAQPSGPLH